MRTHVFAHGVAVFNHPLRGRQDQDTLAQTAQPGTIEFPFDRINRWCRPTTFHIPGCRGLVGVLLAGPGGAAGAQGAHGDGELPGFGRDVSSIAQGV